MRVFISHLFSDEDLASALKSILEEKNIHAYMAQRVKEYELSISDKVRKEIDNSDYVVAIITRNTRESASVNQELGYAQGKGVPRIPMIERESKVGVLLHGMDSEEFAREKFEDACINVRNYLLKKGSRPKTKGKTSDDLFESRSMKDIATPGFGNNLSSSKLYNSVEVLTTSKPVVIFSCCPKLLLEDIKINSPEFREWLVKHERIEIKGHMTPFLPSQSPDVSLGSIVYFNDISDRRTKYLEFQENGFLEQGFTNPLIYPVNDEGFRHPVLNLCWTAGTFWTFVTFCKKYYDYINYDGEFEIRLSISNRDKLTIIGFGGKIDNGKWTEPYNRMWWSEPAPHTDFHHIELKRDISSKEILSEDFTEKFAHEYLNKIANAYGLEFAMCYNQDGSFNFELFSWYR